MGASQLSIELWPNGIVPYVFASNITENHRDLWKYVANEWAKDTCISFKDMNRSSNRNKYGNLLTVRYSSSAGISNAEMGAATSSSMWIGTWDDATVAHEIGHVLGLIHEHQRDDRSNFITAYCNKFKDASQCEMVPNSINILPYDFGSIMHYSKDQDSKSGDSLVPKRAYKKWLNTMGTLGVISKLDKKAIEYVYCRHLQKP